MKLDLSNQQTKFSLHQPSYRAYLNWIMRRVKAIAPGMKWTAVSLVFTDHRLMCALHQEHMGSSKRTDVLSFTYPPQPGDSGYAGEVFVNVERAFQAGPRHRGPAYECALYIAHGCQHLTGAEDHTFSLQRRMRMREHAWLSSANDAGLIAPLIIREH